MTKREAKKAAYHRAANALMNALDAGWEGLDACPSCGHTEPA